MNERDGLDDEEGTCPMCGGEGFVEEEYPAQSNAEEPDIRAYSCPECTPFDEEEDADRDEGPDDREYQEDERCYGDY